MRAYVPGTAGQAPAGGLAPPAEAPTVLVFTANPALAGLDSTLQQAGLDTQRVSSLSQARQVLAARHGRCIAVLDNYQPAPYRFAEVYQLLHTELAVPTLVLVNKGRKHAPLPWRKTGLPETDQVRLPASSAELLLRVQALLLHAGLTALPVPAAGREPARQGQIIVLFALKGGIGRTTIAANLAVGLAQDHGKRVALVDADLWYNGQAALLDLHSDKHLGSLVPYSAHLDADLLRDVLVPHAAGMQVLLGPPDPVQVETIPADLPARVASAYRSMFDYVIVDTHPSMEEYVLQLLEVADRILLVTTPEVGPMRSAAKVLELAPRLGWQDKLQLVVNRADAGVQADQLEAVLGVPVTARIVSAGRPVVDAANRGRPLLLDRGTNEPITRDLRQLAANIAGEPVPAEAPTLAWWRRLLPRPRPAARSLLEGAVAG
jgi:Flp pilus assembly CpaE family ATPase